MKKITDIQKITLGVFIIITGVIVWYFFSNPKVDTNAISNSLKDSTFVKYIERETEIKRLTESNEELKKMIGDNSFKSDGYNKDIQKVKTKIKNNEKAPISNNDVNNIFVKSFTNKLDSIRLGY